MGQVVDPTLLLRNRLVTEWEGRASEIPRDVRPAAEVVETMMEEAAAILRRLGGTLAPV